MKCYRFTQTGTAHARRGAENDDACVLVRHDATALAFVSDGMSSAGYGGDAARLCVDAASHAACATFVPHELMSEESGAAAMRSAFLAAFNEVQKNACATRRPLAEMQATFMAAVFDAQAGVLQFGYCGDGGLLALLKDGSFVVAVQPQKGENANQTSSVLDPASWTFGRMDGVAGFMMATDGLFDRMTGALEDGTLVPSATAGRALAAACAQDAKSLIGAADVFFGSISAGETPFASVSDDRTICVVCADDAPVKALRPARSRALLECPFHQEPPASSRNDEAAAPTGAKDGWSEFVPLASVHERTRPMPRFFVISKGSNGARGKVSLWS